MEELFFYFYILYEIIIDDDLGENVKWLYVFMKYIFWFVLLRLKLILLRILGYVENIVFVFLIICFKFYFWISKEMFEVIL